MQTKTFIGYEELTNKRFKPDSLAEDISRFSLDDLLKIAARLNYLLTYPLLLPGRSQGSADTERFLAESLLSATLRNRLKLVARDWPAKRAIFSRQQGLSFANLALRYGASDSSEEPGSEAGRQTIGRILLGINESLFSRGQLRQLRDSDEAVRRLAVDQQLGYLMELYNPAALQYGLLRVDVMIREEFGRANVTNLRGLFKRARGVELKSYRDLLLSLVVYFLSTSPSEVVKSPDRLTINPQRLVSGNRIPLDELDAVLRAEALSPAALRDAMPTHVRGRLEQDFSLWRRWPLVRLGPDQYICVDPMLLVEKFGSGFRWLLVNAFQDPNERDVALAAFGELAEGYFDWLLRQAGASGLGGDQFYSFPRFGGGGREEGLDGLLVADDHAIVFEHRLGSMPSVVTAGDNPELLLGQVDKVFGQQGGSRVADRIEALFCSDSGQRRKLAGIDLDRVRQVTPVFVVYDTFWRFPTLARRVADEFAQLLDAFSLRQDVVFDRAFLMDVDLLENLMGAFAARTLNLRQCFTAKLLKDPMQKSSLHDFLRKAFPDASREWSTATSRLREVWNGLSQRYFGMDVWP